MSWSAGLTGLEFGDYLHAGVLLVHIQALLTTRTSSISSNTTCTCKSVCVGTCQSCCPVRGEESQIWTWVKLANYSQAKSMLHTVVHIGLHNELHSFELKLN